MEIRTVKTIGFNEMRHPKVIQAVNDFARAREVKYPATAIENFLLDELPKKIRKLQKQKQNSVPQSAS